MKSLHTGKASMLHWGDKHAAFHGEAPTGNPCILDLGQVLGVHGNIVICIHDNWANPMIVDFTNASDWVLIEDDEAEALREMGEAS